MFCVIVYGNLSVVIQQWIPFSFFRFILPSVCVCARACSAVSDSATFWTVSHQAPLSMGFSRQESRSGLPCPPLLQGIFRTQGSKPRLLWSPALQAES